MNRIESEAHQATRREMTLSPEELLQRCMGQAAWVAGCMEVGSDDEWIPHLAVWTKSGFGEVEQVEMNSLHVPFNSDDEKFEAMSGAGLRLAQGKACPTCLIFISEAWQTSDLNFGGGRDGEQPKDDPRRREVMVIQALGVMGAKFLHSFAPLERVDGRLTKPLQFSEFSEPKGRLRLLDWFMSAYLTGVVSKIASRSN